MSGISVSRRLAFITDACGGGGGGGGVVRWLVGFSTNVLVSLSCIYPFRIKLLYTRLPMVTSRPVLGFLIRVFIIYINIYFFKSNLNSKV
jgi:hypothetical protein